MPAPTPPTDFFLQSIGSVLLSAGLRLDVLPGHVGFIVFEDIDAPSADTEPIYHSGIGYSSEPEEVFTPIALLPDEQEVLDKILTFWSLGSEGRPEWVNLTVLLSSQSKDPNTAAIRSTVTPRSLLDDPVARETFTTMAEMPLPLRLSAFASKLLASEQEVQHG